MPTATLSPGHVRPVWAGHPWVYAQAIARLEGGAAAGDEIDVVDPEGRWLGRGLYSPKSAIPVRLFTRDPSARLTRALVVERLRAATARRQRLGLPAADTNAYRLLNAEGDDLPGLVVDRFADVSVVQFGSYGMKRRESLVLEALEEVVRSSSVLDRTSESVARIEGFEAGRGVVRGSPVRAFELVERGLRYEIPLELGQKTGFYLDQRPLRARVEALANGKRVLDAYAYVGSFALTAARGGAERVVAVESSAAAHEAALTCARLNGLEGRVEFLHGDARSALADARRQGRYDVVICDPPKLAPGRAARRRALASMRRLAAASCHAVVPGGIVVLCTCSRAVGAGDLARALALGARDVGAAAAVLERHHQGADHPVPAAFPEGLYLSSLIAEIHPSS